MVYKGGWENEQYHGEGTIYFRGSKYYEGGFENHLRSGKGIQYWQNGKKRSEGYWKNDQRYKFCVIKSFDGSIVKY